MLKVLSAIAPALFLWVLGGFSGDQHKIEFLKIFFWAVFFFSPNVLCIFLPSKYMGIAIGAALLPAVLSALALVVLGLLCALSHSTTASSCAPVFLLLLTQLGIVAFSVAAWIELHIELWFVAMGGAYSLLYLPFAIHLLR
jgi:hypothetical protein